MLSQVKNFFLFAFVFFSVSLNAQRYKKFPNLVSMKKAAPDTCWITCYVADTYTCPPCPPGAECKPCIGDHISATDDVSKKTDLERIFTTRPLDYKKGRKYTFFIRLVKAADGRILELRVIESR